jgi:hypothetical protein
MAGTPGEPGPEGPPGPKGDPGEPALPADPFPGSEILSLDEKRRLNALIGNPLQVWRLNAGPNPPYEFEAGNPDSAEYKATEHRGPFVVLFDLVSGPDVGAYSETSLDSAAQSALRAIPGFFSGFLDGYHKPANRSFVFALPFTGRAAHVLIPEMAMSFTTTRLRASWGFGSPGHGRLVVEPSGLGLSVELAVTDKAPAYDLALLGPISHVLIQRIELYVRAED